MNDSLSDQQPKETEDPLFVKGAMTGMVDAQIADAWPTKATQAPAPAPEGVQRQNSTVYVLNERGTNRWWAQVQPGHDDDDRRVSDQECEAVAAAIRAALQAPAVAHGLVSASVHETIGKLLAEAMNTAVANGANSISMPDEYVQLAVWLSNARGQCCERAAGPGRVCDECASVSAAYSQDMAPIRSAPIWKVISPAGEVFTGESPFRAASVANKHWVKTDPEAAKRFAAALESIGAENEAENARLAAEHGTLDCPACGGSGHVGDIRTAASDVLAERHRQISVEGWTADHDDEHDTEEMAFAAACYATADEGDAPPAVWPWDWQRWKPKDRRSNLVRAGALILAELERLDRAASHPPVHNKQP